MMNKCTAKIMAVKDATYAGVRTPTSVRDTGAGL